MNMILAAISDFLSENSINSTHGERWVSVHPNCGNYSTVAWIAFYDGKLSIEQNLPKRATNSKTYFDINDPTVFDQILKPLQKMIENFEIYVL